MALLLDLTLPPFPPSLKKKAETIHGEKTWFWIHDEEKKRKEKEKDGLTRIVRLLYLETKKRQVVKRRGSTGHNQFRLILLGYQLLHGVHTVINHGPWNLLLLLGGDVSYCILLLFDSTPIPYRKMKEQNPQAQASVQSTVVSPDLIDEITKCHKCPIKSLWLFRCSRSPS